MLVRIFIDKSGHYREQQDFDVQHQCPVFDIVQIAVDAHADRSVTTIAIDLCPAGDTRADLMLDHIAWNFFFKLLYEKWPFRSWTDKTHISF